MSTSLGHIVVTGGAGFIGVSLAAALAAEAESWTIVDNLHPQVHPGGRPPVDLHPSARLVVADVTDADAWDDLLTRVRPDTVVHLAAETGTAQSLHEATRHAEANVVGTTAMLDAFGRAGHVPAHLVLSSSRAVYGEGQWRTSAGDLVSPGQRSHAQLTAGQWDFAGCVPVPSSAATTPPAPTSVYGATKLAQEHILRAWSSSHDVRLSVLRLQNVYGPGQSLINPYTGIVTLFSQLAKRGEAIPIYEDGRIVRDFVYIDDVRDAFLDVILRGPRDGAAAWDVGSGIGTTILELASEIARFHGAPAPVITGAYRDGDVRHAECTIEATLTGLEWAPQWSVERGIAALQDWIDARNGSA